MDIGPEVQVNYDKVRFSQMGWKRQAVPRVMSTVLEYITFS